MQNHPFRSSNAGKFIAALIAVIIAAAATYIGYDMIIQWHRQSLREAVKQREAALSAKIERLERSVRQLEKRLQMRERRRTEEAAAAEPEDRLRKVFGEPPDKEPVRTMDAMETPDCFRLEKQINSFFGYLDRQGYLDAASVEAEGSRQVFEEMLSILSESPPLVVGETQDLVSLMHNQAHFFRLLEKERIELVKYILNMDADVLEHAMGNFYDYYVEHGGCGGKRGGAVSLETLYEYAAFFLNTFSGKSYLMRRGSSMRCLVRYYSVLVLDRANKATVNRHGIDIRPHIELALDDIRHQQSLLYQDVYIKRLSELQEKYM